MLVKLGFVCLFGWVRLDALNFVRHDGCGGSSPSTLHGSHVNKQTTWLDPRDNVWRRREAGELPFGWSAEYHPRVGMYFVDNVNHTSSQRHPKNGATALQLGPGTSLPCNHEGKYIAGKLPLSVVGFWTASSTEKDQSARHWLDHLPCRSVSENSVASLGLSSNPQCLQRVPPSPSRTFSGCMPPVLAVVWEEYQNNQAVLERTRAAIVLTMTQKRVLPSSLDKRRRLLDKFPLDDLVAAELGQLEHKQLWAVGQTFGRRLSAPSSTTSEGSGAPDTYTNEQAGAVALDDYLLRLAELVEQQHK